MRLSTIQIFQSGINGILDSQSRVFDTEKQLASGKRFTSPSEDPYGATQVLGLDAALRTTEQYLRNSDMAEARLSLEEGTLDSAGDLLQRARELAVQGLNDTQGADGRKAIAEEIYQLADQMMALGNTQDAGGEYIFAGFKTKVSGGPFSHDGSGGFTYQGDQGGRALQIGPTRQVAISDSGTDVFMKIPAASGSGYENVFSTLYQLASDLDANNPQDSSLTSIDNAVENLSTIRARIGSRLNSIDNQRQVNESMSLQIEQTRSSIQDLDYAEAASDLNRHMLTLQAAQAAFVKTQNLSLFSLI